MNCDFKIDIPVKSESEFIGEKLLEYNLSMKEMEQSKGYKIFGVLEDCPQDHKCYCLSKKL